MVRTWRLPAVVLVRMQAGCVASRTADGQYGGVADAGRPREGFACRMLHGDSTVASRHHSTGSGDGYAVAAVLVLWPVLAGACWASRA